MIEKMRDAWQSFKESEPGQRFKDRYRRRQQSKSGKFDLGLVASVLGGILIVLGGIVAVPGPRLAHRVSGVGAGCRRVPAHRPLYGLGRGKAEEVGTLGCRRMDKLAPRGEGPDRRSDPGKRRRLGVQRLPAVLWLRN